MQGFDNGADGYLELITALFFLAATVSRSAYVVHASSWPAFGAATPPAHEPSRSLSLLKLNTSSFTSSAADTYASDDFVRSS